MEAHCNANLISSSRRAIPRQDNATGIGKQRACLAGAVSGTLQSPDEKGLERNENGFKTVGKWMLSRRPDTL